MGKNSENRVQSQTCLNYAEVHLCSQELQKQSPCRLKNRVQSQCMLHSDLRTKLSHRLYKQKHKKLPWQHASAYSTYDARHLFFLISQLIDKNPCLTSLPLKSLHMLSWAKTIALQAQQHFFQCTVFSAKRCFFRGDGWVSIWNSDVFLIGGRKLAFRHKSRNTARKAISFWHHQRGFSCFC